MRTVNVHDSSHVGSIGTLVERQIRLIRLMHLATRDADSLRIAIATTSRTCSANSRRGVPSMR